MTFLKLARHGIRSPKQAFQDDISASKWTNWGGLDKLTNFGIVQELEFGRFLKNYYSFFLESSSNLPDDVYARYSHCASTFLSTLCVLNGLFGANNTQSMVDSVRCRDDMVRDYFHNPTLFLTLLLRLIEINCFFLHVKIAFKYHLKGLFIRYII